MCDFDDDFGEDGFMEEESFEDEFHDEIMGDMDDQDDGLSRDEQEPDGFYVRDAFFVGSIVGNAYEEALDERKRHELLKKKRRRRDPNFD
jgi:hypothetical protein